MGRSLAGGALLGANQHVDTVAAPVSPRRSTANRTEAPDGQARRGHPRHARRRGRLFPYLDDQHAQYAMELLTRADGLLLGRSTYEGLSAAYTAMADEAPAGVPAEFIRRMNSIPKFVASTTLRELTWNATAIEGDVASFVDDLKRNSGQNLLKYGNGPLDVTLMEHELIDEFHLFLTPVAIGTGT
ncbi:MAG: dihydrofolate reductase family protein, partial [Solirubrobacteraceae bacterium]